MAILTSYMYVQLTVMCVCYTIDHLHFSTAVLLLFAADCDDLIFLLFDSLSETVDIAPVFNNTLTFRTPKGSSNLLHC